MTSPLAVRLDRHGDVAVLSLARPEGANAIDMGLVQALDSTADRLAAEGWARAIVLRADGKIFCAGGDVKGFTAVLESGPDALPDHIGDLAGALHRAMEKLLALDAPLLAAVNGPAAGAGMSLALAADLAYGGPRAKLTPAYGRIGLSADGGMTWTLPRIVGERRAAQILLLNETLGAEEAARLGLFTEALSEDGEAFDAAVLARAQKVAEGPRRAQGIVRRLIRQSASASLHDQLAAEAEGMAALAAGDDVREGLTAFGEKRGPRFRQ